YINGNGSKATVDEIKGWFLKQFLIGTCGGEANIFLKEAKKDPELSALDLIKKCQSKVSDTFYLQMLYVSMSSLYRLAEQIQAYEKANGHDNVLSERILSQHQLIAKKLKIDLTEDTSLNCFDVCTSPMVYREYCLKFYQLNPNQKLIQGCFYFYWLNNG